MPSQSSVYFLAGKEKNTADTTAFTIAAPFYFVQYNKMNEKRLYMDISIPNPVPIIEEDTLNDEDEIISELSQFMETKSEWHEDASFYSPRFN